jgi:hypothetical protein
MTSKVQEYIDEINERYALLGYTTTIDKAEAYRLTYAEATNERMHLDLMLRCLEFVGLPLCVTDPATKEPESSELRLIAEQMSAYPWFPDLRMGIAIAGNVGSMFWAGDGASIRYFSFYAGGLVIIDHSVPQCVANITEHGSLLDFHLRRLPL